MKNLIKGAFITVGILLLVGLILVGLGMSFGGANSDHWVGLNLTQKIWNSIPSSLWYSHGNNYDYDFDIDERDFNEIIQGNNQSVVINGSEISNLEIALGAAYLSIEESLDDDYHIESSTKYKYGYEVSNNTLTIEGLRDHSNWKRGNNFNATGFTDEIKILIPKDSSLDEIELFVAAGDVEITNLTSDLISYNGGVGRTDISKMQGDEIRIKMGVGDLEIGEIEARFLDISGGIGSVEVFGGKIERGLSKIGMGITHYEGHVEEEFRIEGGIGSTKLLLEGIEEDYSFEIEGGLGEVRVGDHRYGIIGGETISRNSQENVGGKKIIINSGMGNIDIDFK